MTIQQNLSNAFVAVADSDRALRTLITGTATGDLTTLTTTTKASIIAAINELEDTISNFAANIIDDADAASLISTYSASKIEERLGEIRDSILGGASAAYDTLLELQTEIQSNDTELGQLLTAVGNRVRFDAAQTLTSTEQGTARTNIGAASQADLTALTGRVTTAESDIDTLQSDLDALEAIVTAADIDYTTVFTTTLNA